MSDNPAQARDRAISLAHSDPSAAITLAREINDPWFACQALAWVGRFWPGDDFESVINEAFEIGQADAVTRTRLSLLPHGPCGLS